MAWQHKVRLWVDDLPDGAYDNERDIVAIQKRLDDFSAEGDWELVIMRNTAIGNGKMAMWTLWKRKIA